MESIKGMPDYLEKIEKPMDLLTIRMRMSVISNVEIMMMDNDGGDTNSF